MKLNLRTHITIPAWVAGIAAAVSVGCGVLALQLSRVLFTVIRESDYEAARMVTGVATAVQSDSTEILIPDEMYLEDEAKDVYSYGALQTILFRRTPQGVTDWQWSFNGAAWYNTDDTQADHATLLDPPNLIFICRLQLQSVARRKSASLKAKLLGQPNSHLGGRHIPPPLDTEDTPRDVFEAPDTLCCPISSCVMTQPVVAPSGKSFDYAALCEWVVRHGTDPTTNQALSLHDLYPNLVLREQVERWLAGEDLGFNGPAAAAADGDGSAGGDGAAAAAAAAADGAAGDAAAAPGQGMPGGTPVEAGPASRLAAMGSAPAAAAAAAGAETITAEGTADAETGVASSGSSRSNGAEQSEQQQECQPAGDPSTTTSSSSSSNAVDAAGGDSSQHQPAASSSTGDGASSSSRTHVHASAPHGDSPLQQATHQCDGGGSGSSGSSSNSGVSGSSGGVPRSVILPAGACGAVTAAAASGSQAASSCVSSSGGEQEVEDPSPAGLAAVLQPLRHHLPAVGSSGSGTGVPSSSSSGLGQASSSSSSSSSAGQLCSSRGSSSISSSSREWQRGPGADSSSSSGCGGALRSVGQAPRVSAGYVPRHVQPALAGGLLVGLPTPAMLQATRLVQL